MDDFNNLEIDDLEVILTSTEFTITDEEAQTISGGTSANINDIRFSDKIKFDRILKLEVTKIEFTLPTSGACFACGMAGFDPRIEVPSGVIRPTSVPNVNGFDSVCDHF